MKKKSLEGIESLLFVLGAVVGYILSTQDYSWWIILLVVIALSVLMGKLVDYLRKMNEQLT